MSSKHCGLNWFGSCISPGLISRILWYTSEIASLLISLCSAVKEICTTRRLFVSQPNRKAWIISFSSATTEIWIKTKLHISVYYYKKVIMFIMITIMIIMQTLIWETDINWVINKEVFVEVVQTRLVTPWRPLVKIQSL